MMELTLRNSCKDFITKRNEDRMGAMQRVALQIIAGIDMDTLLNASKDEKNRAENRLTRLIERERLKGVSGHWSYDLNRHIALKQALDRLLGRTVVMRSNSQLRHVAHF
ncbi:MULTISPECIES: cytoplasmic protein [unclassified Ochrobactrum]|uniref:cytoplasmic protein n=1 Tax=unclassified Ochrobactrum TaxID=239106 RepID=UPI0030B072CC